MTLPLRRTRRRRKLGVQWWSYNHDFTTTWNVRITFWRFQLGACLVRHAYGTGRTDRWVLQPNLVYDRRRVRRKPARRKEAA